MAEGKPAPALSGSADIRSLNMDDFKDAHERVKRISNSISMPSFSPLSLSLSLSHYCGFKFLNLLSGNRYVLVFHRSPST